MGKILGAAAAVFLLVIGQATAADMTAKAKPAIGTLAFAPDAAWAKPLKDNDMAELRGGLGGTSFTAFFAIFDELQNAQISSLTVNPSNVNVLSPPQLGGTGLIELSSAIGSFPTNSTGIFQQANIVGDFNVVNQNVLIHLNVINIANAASLSSLLGSTSGTTPQ